MSSERRDEVELAAFLRAQHGVRLMSAGQPSSMLAAAVLGKALARYGAHLTGILVASTATRIDDDEVLHELRPHESIVVVGEELHVPRWDGPAFLVTPLDGEPLCQRALRLTESMAHTGDALWLAAAGLLRDPRPHAIIERALARHTRADLLSVGDLLEAASRSHMPGLMSAIALELLVAAPDPRRFLVAEPCELLRQCQTMVTFELNKAARLRPRAGHGVVVIEYDSACRIEDLVAQRWRGLRPGTAILAANHGWVEGRVAVVARSVAPESLERLRPILGERGEALLSPAAWQQLLASVGLTPLTLTPTEKEEPAIVLPTDATQMN